MTKTHYFAVTGRHPKYILNQVFDLPHWHTASRGISVTVNKIGILLTVTEIRNS
jgi:hypothetical protein